MGGDTGVEGWEVILGWRGGGDTGVGGDIGVEGWEVILGWRGGRGGRGGR